eukprot:3714767-Pyramimonas_sp.AAC.1
MRQSSPHSSSLRPNDGFGVALHALFDRPRAFLGALFCLWRIRVPADIGMPLPGKRAGFFLTSDVAICRVEICSE